MSTKKIFEIKYKTFRLSLVFDLKGFWNNVKTDNKLRKVKQYTWYGIISQCATHDEDVYDFILHSNSINIILYPFSLNLYYSIKENR